MSKSLQELSREKLASYVTKAADSVSILTAKNVKAAPFSAEKNKTFEKGTRRLGSIRTAARKLAKKTQRKTCQI